MVHISQSAWRVLALIAASTPGAVGAQVAGSAPVAADQGAPGDHDSTATHDGNAPPATEESKKRPPPVDLAAVYTGEIWRNQRGGVRRGERYLDNLDITLTIDAERALGWRGATLFVYGLYNNGRAFSGDLVGDAQIVSNIETGTGAARLFQAWIEQRFAGDNASIKVGLYDLNSEFDTSNVGSLSLLSSHGIGPEFAHSGRNGPSIFPVTSLAVRGEHKFSEKLVARAAVLDGVPGDPDRPGRTAIKLSGRDGMLAVAELGYVGEQGKASIGFWRYTAAFPSYAAQAGLTSGSSIRGNDGLYVVVERQLTLRSENIGLDRRRGLAGFIQGGVADARFNRIHQYVGAGLVYTGLVRPEGDDRAGVTVARAALASGYRRLAATMGERVNRAELVVEVTYRTPLTPWLTVQPDVQYIASPSAGRSLPDALAIGLRFKIGI